MNKVIELKGIARNLTKLGVQDGQCDDIVNLRFKDGSWRVADDGKVMLDADNGLPFNVSDYSQLYVHTNVYHHLLGVKQGKLYWFANIGADGESFTYIKGSNGAPSPVEICDAQGDVTIVQNGHLLTIISAASTDTTPLPFATSTEDVIKYAIFKTGTNEYKVLKVDQNGEQTDRGLYPFGRVHLNLNCEAKEFTHINEDAGEIKLDIDKTGENFKVSFNHTDSGALVPADNDENADRTLTAKQLWHASMLDAYNQAKEENYFTKHLLALVAVKMYDGSYIYASAPVLLSPYERYSLYKQYFNSSSNADVATGSVSLYYPKNAAHTTQEEVTLSGRGYDQKIPVYKFGVFDNGQLVDDNGNVSIASAEYRHPVYFSGSYGLRVHLNTEDDEDMTSQLTKVCDTPKNKPLTSVVYGSSMILTLGDLSTIIENSDVFTGVSIFITHEVDAYKMGADNYKDGEVFYHSYAARRDNADGATASYTIVGNVMYKPAIRPDDEIIHDLTNSPCYLLREYSLNELKTMSNTSIEVDLSAPQYKGLLANIEQQPTLNMEAFDRQDFFPRTAYSYNQKLHIANYKLNQFHGYPIDCFQLSNHSVKVESGSYAVGGVLPNLIDGSDVQYSRSKYPFLNHSPSLYDQYIQASKDKGYCFASIRVLIETQQGDQQVVRYIQPYEAHKFTNGDNANFVESLGALLTFPSHRAKEMEIAVISLHEGKVYRRSKTFKLTPHPYLNIAYYIDPKLKPIDLPVVGSSTGVDFDDFNTGSQIGLFVTPSERNNTEDYPNGLKVSLSNNPFFFPYETTYQVGSSEIVALMSNAVAVGTGQTGAAPLYVFCKDGIYSLMVDSSGEMTYTNARIIARDVCNNAKSVTPIDSGVVFTTDRGIMSIAGSEVVEIGSAAEGDVFDITDNGNLPTNPAIADKGKKIMFNAFTMRQLAGLPERLIDNVDFLTYLKGAIVNYNHNERELMISNPDCDYTYVMDRNGNWSRRAFSANEYVNNYPTSYRVDKEGNFYKVDVDDYNINQVYLLSNVIKLDTIGFKQAYGLVVRGQLETSGVAYGEINGTKVNVVGSFIDKMEGGETLRLSYIYMRGESLWVDIDNNNYVLSEQIKILDIDTGEDVTTSITQTDSERYFQITKSYETIGCYVFGSYDGRQWSLLGGNEKNGKFTDIGCKVSHTDVKFLRICMAGKLLSSSRIDFVEIEYNDSNLNTKLR